MAAKVIKKFLANYKKQPTMDDNEKLQ